MNEYIIQIERWSDHEVQTYTIPAENIETATKQAMSTYFMNNPGDKAKLRAANPVIRT